MSKYYQKCKKSIRKYKLRTVFGLTPQDYDDMLAEQDGRCGICQQKVGDKRLCIDHSHTTGQIRGLLCHHCNVALGLFKDSTESLVRAIEWVSRSRFMKPPKE